MCVSDFAVTDKAGRRVVELRLGDSSRSGHVVFEGREESCQSNLDPSFSEHVPVRQFLGAF